MTTQVYNPLQESSWSIHVRAACNLVATRGPETPIDPKLLCFIRTLGVSQIICFGALVTYILAVLWEHRSPPSHLPTKPPVGWDYLREWAIRTTFEHCPHSTSARVALWQSRANSLCRTPTHCPVHWHILPTSTVVSRILESQKFCSFEIRAATPGEPQTFPSWKTHFQIDMSANFFYYARQASLWCITRLLSSYEG
jgi:hypothetical protein